jgi:CheY-like chemotaxis protein
MILIAEDNDDNRFIAATVLRHAGYDVREAINATAAIRIAREEQPSLILMDVGLPDLDGWTATRLLKDDPSTAGIPVVAFTAHSLRADRQRAQEVGCSGFLAKPVEPARLVREVARTLETFQ